MTNATGSPDKKKTFWDTFLQAVKTDPVEIRSLRSSSGLSHPVVAAGADRVRKSLVVISGDPDGRSAALAQADVQAQSRDHRLIFARPSAVNPAKAAEGLAVFFRKLEITQRDVDRLVRMAKRGKPITERRVKRVVQTGFVPALRALGYATLNGPAAWQDFFIQLSHVQFASAEPTQDDTESLLVRIGSLIALDPSETDRQMGVCSVPFYELSAEQAEVFHSGTDIEAVLDILAAHHIYQYFFPAPDSLALGLIEKEPVPSSVLNDRLKRVPEIGHPFGSAELVPGDVKMGELVDMLKERGFSVEGEVGLELTESGRTSRATVRFKPREGLLSKLSHIFSVKMDLSPKDFFK
jgi:hypothetical protein